MHGFKRRTKSVETVEGEAGMYRLLARIDSNPRHMLSQGTEEPRHTSQSGATEEIDS